MNVKPDPSRSSVWSIGHPITGHHHKASRTGEEGGLRPRAGHAGLLLLLLLLLPLLPLSSCPVIQSSRITASTPKLEVIISEQRLYPGKESNYPKAVDLPLPLSPIRNLLYSKQDQLL
ncbi:hypothetical protein BO86DRAFT_30412 [Aspergillus japonicus CBS 114.51]|uniref:Uncharacterized protein n=1 Tax=Aspergillus japonicus CBS 114.51 TaxID=1448312 RepID=A0A8T8WJY5_ASPJA|nr:hypothetical protein BO86DRAFT_30412 [Aspergillus japonicus CBS 114.51]RAH76057.1 hypothetical protein BO86DRAFT_30412 [Aspergillus japonicus CBS 114.51]